MRDYVHGGDCRPAARALDNGQDDGESPADFRAHRGQHRFAHAVAKSLLTAKIGITVVLRGDGKLRETKQRWRGSCIVRNATGY
jgi:predicted cobalt transporter CbtA